MIVSKMNRIDLLHQVATTAGGDLVAGMKAQRFIFCKEILVSAHLTLKHSETFCKSEDKNGIRITFVFEFAPGDTAKQIVWTC